MVKMPRALLPHSAQLLPYTGSDSWSEGQYGDPVNLRYVRLEPSSRVVRNRENIECQLSARMFYDCVNSLPLGIEFSEESKVVFRGKEYTVVLVDTEYADTDAPHHYELGLA